MSSQPISITKRLDQLEAEIGVLRQEVQKALNQSAKVQLDYNEHIAKFHQNIKDTNEDIKLMVKEIHERTLKLEKGLWG